MFFLAAVAIASAAGSMYETTLAEQAQLEQINIQTKQRELQLSQKKISVYDETQKTLQRQMAQATTRGVGLDSASFNAIQRDTLNTASNTFENIKTEEDMTSYNKYAEKENARNTMYAKLFGQAGNAAMGFATLRNGKMT